MSILNSFTYNGQNSLNYGIVITSATAYNTAERDTSNIALIGHNGDFIQSNMRYKNVPVSYSCAIIPQTQIWNRIDEQITAIAVWLNSCTENYAELIDTYNTNVYRMAHFSGKIELQKKGLIYEFTASFDCEPFKYNLISTKKSSTITSSGANISLTDYKAYCGLPLITLKPYFSTTTGMNFSLNGLNWFIASNTEVTIDSKLGKVYNGENFFFYHNGSAENFIAPRGMPELVQGENVLHIDSFYVSNIAEITINPRWCYL